MDNNTALIVLDTNIVASTKVDQAVWILTAADKELSDIVDRYSLLDVTSDDEKVEAEQGVMVIRKTRKSWDGMRKEWGQPLDLTKKAMDGAMRQRDDPAGEIEAGLIQKVQSYSDQLERERRAREEEARRAAEEANKALREKQEAEQEAARKAAEEAGKAYVEPEPVGIPEVVVKTEPPREVARAEGISYIRKWLYRVDDLAQVPDAYTMRVLDPAKVDAAMKAATSVRPGEKLSTCTAQIPGITIWHEDRPRVG